MTGNTDRTDPWGEMSEWPTLHSRREKPMLVGPVGSPYPGKYACFAMASLCAVVAWRSSRSAFQGGSTQRRSAALGTSFKPDIKRSVGANATVAVVATCLLTALLVAIYRAWPK